MHLNHWRWPLQNTQSLFHSCHSAILLHLYEANQLDDINKVKYDNKRMTLWLTKDKSTNLTYTGEI